VLYFVYLFWNYSENVDIFEKHVRMWLHPYIKEGKNNIKENCA
jgi:hypothetical protein